MVHAAIFDMDGILFDTERLCCDAWRAVSSEEGYVMDDSLFFSCVGRNNRDTRDIVMATLGEGFPYERFNVRAREWMRTRMEESGPPEKPGVRTILQYFSDKSVPVALATSTGEKSARWMIERAGLSGFFTAYAFGSEVERGKPEPDIFLLANRRLGGFQPSNCAVFEDSPAGLKAGSSAGMRTVFVPDMIASGPETAPFVWKQIESLEEAAFPSFYDDM